MKRPWGLTLFASLILVVSTTTSAQRRLPLDVYVADDNGWCVTSTLIYGITEAVLIDTQYYKSHAAKLADRVAATGARLKAIIITHPHDDHYMGSATIHERFPDTPIYMTAAALEDFKQKSAGAITGMKKYVPAETPDTLPLPQILPTPHLLVDGQAVEVMQGQGDDLNVTNSYVWIPSLRALITGDIVFNGVHVWLTNSNEQSRAAWLVSLSQLAALHPRILVAGHKKSVGAKDGADALAFTGKYIRDFEATRKSATNAEELFAAMKTKYPDVALADKILSRTARKAFSK